MDISTSEILINVKKISRDPDINFPVNWKFGVPDFPGGDTNSNYTVNPKDETIPSTGTRSNLDSKLDNDKGEIRICDDYKDIGLYLTHDVAYSDKATNTILCASTAISIQFKTGKAFQAEETSNCSSITNFKVFLAYIDDNELGLTFETNQDLGDYKRLS